MRASTVFGRHGVATTPVGCSLRGRLRPLMPTTDPTAGNCDARHTWCRAASTCQQTPKKPLSSAAPVLLCTPRTRWSPPTSSCKKVLVTIPPHVVGATFSQSPVCDGVRATRSDRSKDETTIEEWYRPLVPLVRVTKMLVSALKLRTMQVCPLHSERIVFVCVKRGYYASFFLFWST